MSPEQQQAFIDFIDSGGFQGFNPGSGGTTYIPGIGNINIGGFGPMTGGNQTGSSRVTPVAAVQGLQIQQGNVPTNVAVATEYGLSGATPPTGPTGNPFERPETQQGIGSLAGGG